MESLLTTILSKCICGCKSDCCESDEITPDKNVKKHKKLFHIEANLGRNKSKNKDTPEGSLSSNNEK